LRAIKNLNDVQIVLRDLLNQQQATNTKALDRKGLQIKNMGPGVEPNDAVTVSQLQSVVTPVVNPNQNFTIVFDNSGSPNNGDVFAPYVFGKSRVGYPTEVWIQAVAAPTSGVFEVELLFNGSNILNTNIQLAIGNSGPVFSSNFVNPLPNFGYQGILKGSVVNAGSASNVSVGICVQRNTTTSNGAN
jgi:hypothetical protein